MNLLKLLLFPLAVLYNAVMRVRNHLYDIGHKRSFEFETSVIAVGNLNVGGSGKTPMIEYLVDLLASRFPLVTLSRGYKRETFGYRVVTGEDTARSVGDEPLQLFRKFGKQIRVSVGEDRIYAIPHILQEFPETRALLLDDAMQQRAIKPAMTILVTTRQKPFFQDFLLPYGRLRESRSGARRADAVVITKCEPQMADQEQRRMEEEVRKYAGEKPVFFSEINYGKLVALRNEVPCPEKVILVTGIANAEPLRAYCAGKYNVLRHFRFSDHHMYKEADLAEIENFCAAQRGDVGILTTEKDAVRLDVPEFSTFLDRRPWYSMPIRHVFLKDGAKFDNLVIEAVTRELK